MVNSCLTVEYPPVHRSVVVVDTSLLGCGSRSVYVFYTRWDVQWRFWSDCYCTCWLCIVTTGRNKGLSFPVCLKSLCVKCSVVKATAAHPSYAATRWETQSQAIDGYNGSTFNCCLCGGYRRFGLDSLFFWLYLNVNRYPRDGGSSLWVTLWTRVVSKSHVCEYKSVNK